MSAITIENDLVHYEVLGRGRPVIFVHGWLGSWRYWVPTMQQLSVKYRTYALDLWGFGDSGKEANRYGFKDQVQLLTEFMDKLGITKAALVGHSLGAAVCLRFAAQHPDRAPRVALINPPLFDLGGLDDAAAPITVNTPQPAAVNAPVPAPAIPAATQSAPAPAAPMVTTPATQPATPGTTGTTPVPTPTPAASPTTPNAAPAATTPPAPAPAAPAAPVAPEDVPTTPDTIVRNPLKGMGESPEEILARLQAKNTQAASGTTAAKPVLPAGIGTPILPTQPPADAPATTPTAPATEGASAQPTTPASTPPAPAQPATPAAATPATPPTTPSTPAATPTSTPAQPSQTTPPPPAPTTPAPTTTSPAPVPATPPAPAAPPTSVAPLPGLPNMPVRTDAPNPLLKYLSGKPVELLNRYVAADAPDMDKLLAEVKKTDESALVKSAQSFNGINLSVELHRLQSPTLILHGKDDPVLPAPSDDLLNRINKGKQQGTLLAFVEPDVRHFPMLEISAKFNRLLMDFLEAADLANVQFKDQWRRTLR